MRGIAGTAMVALGVAGAPVAAGAQPQSPDPGVSLTLDPVKRRIVELAPELDPRQIVAQFGLQKPRFVSIPAAAGGGFVVSFAADPSVWVELEPALCGPVPGVLACEDDLCKEFLLPATPAPPPQAAPGAAPPGDGLALAGRVTRPDGTPLPDTTLALLPEAPPIESVLDELQPYDWAGALAGARDPRPPEPALDALIEWTPGPAGFGATDALGRFELRVDDRWSDATELVAGAGWESVRTRVRPPPPPPDDDGDDPRDAQPRSYGEEIDDPRVGILLVRADDAWLPRFNNSTRVVARIYEPRGAVWVPSKRERVMRVEFVERSQEEGRCLNSDLARDPQDSPDLYFPAEANQDLSCTDDPSGKGNLFGSCITRQARSIQELSVGSQDFGGFSRLRASCEDCVALRPPGGWRSAFGTPPVAFEVNAANDEDLLRVPKDDNDNQIADAWIWDLLDSPQAEDDSDATPEGNGVAGDGLSAYEEYRGFLVRGRHQRTGPRRKDLFVDNRDALPMGIFSEASQLAVWDVSEDELEDQVINFNAGHANVVEQHGLLLRDRKLGGGVVGRAEMGAFDSLLGRMGPPKWVDEVKVDRAAFGGRPGRLPGTVAHELGHAVGVRHHGQGTETDRDVSIDLELTGAELSFTGNVSFPGDRLCGRQLPAELYLRDKHHQTSGAENCVMRYRGFGTAYLQADGSIDCEPPAPPRRVFCSTPAGASFNAGDRTASHATLGSCEKRIQVNDR